MDLSGLGGGKLKGCCEDGNEPSRCIKLGVCLE